MAASYWGRRPINRFLSTRHGSDLIWLLAIALLVRLLPILLLPVGAGYDIDSFILVGQAILGGKEVYSSGAAGRHPYLPMQVYLIGATFWAAQQTAIPFVIWVKLPALLADVGITALIFQVTRRQTDRAAACQNGLLYALNPISLLVSAYHGQFDAIAVLLLLLAWYLYQFQQQRNRSAFALGWAILNKTWPVVFLPIVFMRLHSWRERIVYMLIAVVIPVALTLFYIRLFSADPSLILNRALTHAGVAGYWGHSAILAFLAQFVDWAQPAYDALLEIWRPLLVIAGLTALWGTRSQDSLNALVTVILAEFAVSVGMGIQWLLWVVPFAILSQDVRWLRRYSLTGSLFMLAHLYGLHMYPWVFELWGTETATMLIRLSSLPAWVTVVLWTADRLLRPMMDLRPR